MAGRPRGNQREIAFGRKWGFLAVVERREKSKPGLKVVEDEPGEVEEVLRIREGGHQPEAVDAVPVVVEAPAPERLEAPGRESFEGRTEEPDIDAIIDVDDDLEDVEEVWGKALISRPVPHGWFVLILVGMTAIGLWAVMGLRESEEKVEEVRREVIETVLDEGEALEQAHDFVEGLEEHLASYLASDEVGERAKLVRDPERVRPLMDDWYSARPLEGGEYAGIRVCQPITVEGRPFWVVSVAVTDGEPHDFLVEQLDDDRVLIDWETKVAYQPMRWDDYVVGEGEPAGEFRVRLQPDVFHTSDFPEEEWSSYRLTAPGSDEFMFGFAPRDGVLGGRLEEVAKLGRWEPAAAILKLRRPGEGGVRRTVVIEDLVSPNWTRVKPWRWADGTP